MLRGALRLEHFGLTTASQVTGAALALILDAHASSVALVSSAGMDASLARVQPLNPNPETLKPQSINPWHACIPGMGASTKPKPSSPKTLKCKSLPWVHH